MARGIGLTIDEALEDARQAQWGLSESMAYALHEPTHWGVNAPESFRLWSAFLRAAFEEAPDQFPSWVMRLMDAAKAGIPHWSYGIVARNLLLIAWKPFQTEQRPFIQALVRELRSARYTFGWYADPVAETGRQLVILHGDEEKQEVGRLMNRSFIQEMEFADQLMLLGL